MYFNPTTEAQSIVGRIDRICQTDSNTYSLIQKANDCNEALDRFWYLAMLADGRWQLDDTNYTDLPIGTTNLISGQQDYSFASDVMEVLKVLVQDSAGNWNELQAVDISQTKHNRAARNIWEVPSSDDGIPTHYDKTYNSLLLSPVPNYNKTGGLKVVFQRGPSYFASTDTTKQPGIPVIFHNYIVKYAALQFLIAKQLPKKNDLALEVQRDEQAITDYFSHRAKDEPTRILPVYRNPR